MSNAAALQIVAVSTDVMFNTIEDVFVTGICRAATGIGCTTIPGVRTRATACDVAAGRVINVHYMTSAKQTRLWNFLADSGATERVCRSKLSALHLVFICLSLLSIIFYFSIYRHKHFSPHKLFALQGK